MMSPPELFRARSPVRVTARRKSMLSAVVRMSAAVETTAAPSWVNVPSRERSAAAARVRSPKLVTEKGPDAVVVTGPFRVKTAPFRSMPAAVLVSRAPSLVVPVPAVCRMLAAVMEPESTEGVAGTAALPWRLAAETTDREPSLVAPTAAAKTMLPAPAVRERSSRPALVAERVDRKMMSPPELVMTVSSASTTGSRKSTEPPFVTMSLMAAVPMMIRSEESKNRSPVPPSIAAPASTSLPAPPAVKVVEPEPALVTAPAMVRVPFVVVIETVPAVLPCARPESES